MIRKFEVEVVRTDKYTVTIDEDKIPRNLISDFENTIYYLGEDKTKELAEHIAFNAVDNNNEFYEGIGYIKRDNLTFGNDVVEGIEIKTEFAEDYDCEVNEV